MVYSHENGKLELEWDIKKELLVSNKELTLGYKNGKVKVEYIISKIKEIRLMADLSIGTKMEILKQKVCSETSIELFTFLLGTLSQFI